MNILDRLVRRAAKSFLLKFLDGKKTYIFRAVQAVNSILVFLYLACPSIPDINGVTGCGMVDIINGHWLAISTLLGQVGLEFGIMDAKVKAKMARGEP